MLPTSVFDEFSSHLAVSQSGMSDESLTSAAEKYVNNKRPTRFTDKFFIHLIALNNSDGFYLSSRIHCCAPPQTSKPILLLLWKSCNIKTFINLIWGFETGDAKEKHMSWCLYILTYQFKSRQEDTHIVNFESCSFGHPRHLTTTPQKSHPDSTTTGKYQKM